MPYSNLSFLRFSQKEKSVLNMFIQCKLAYMAIHGLFLLMKDKGVMATQSAESKEFLGRQSRKETHKK